MKRLNLRLAIILGTIILACVGGVFFLHDLQIKRNAGNWLIQARQLKNADKINEAERALSRYVAFRPEDEKAAEEMLALHKQLFEQEPPKYFKLLGNSYERMVSFQPDNAELRRAYVDYLIKHARNTSSAQQQLAVIRKLGKTTAEDEYNEAALLAYKNPEAAIPLFAKVIGFDTETKSFNEEVSKNSKQYKAYLQLAFIYQQQPITAELAPLMIEELLKQHAEVVEAQRLAFEFWARKGDTEKARQALAKAVELAPDDLDVLNLQFNQFQHTRNFPAAMQIAERMEKLAPKSANTYLNLATVYDVTQQRDKALESLERGMGKVHDRLLLMVAKLILTIKEGPKQSAAAREIFAQLQGTPVPTEKMNLFEGQILINEGKFSAALDKLTAASKRLTEPQDQFQAEIGQAQCYTALGSYDLARTIYVKILNTYPGMHDVRIVLANLLMRTGKTREAQHEYELLSSVLKENVLTQPRIWQPLLDTRIAEQLARPAANRDWKSVNDLVGKLKELPNDVLTAEDKTLLQARIFAQQGDLESALGSVVPLRQQQPDNVKYWFEWALLESKRGKPRELLEQIAAAPPAVQQDQRMLLIQGNQWAAIGGEEGKAGLLELLNKTAGLEKDDRLTIHLLVSQALARMGQLEEAEKVATTATPLAEGTNPRDLRPQQVLLAYARDRGDIPAMEKLYVQIRKESEPDSDNQLYSQSLLILAKLRESQKKKIHNTSVQVVLDASEEKLLQEAQTLADKLLEKRSDWSETYKLLADIAGYRNNVAAMINALKTARSKGDLEPYRLKQLAQLLYQSGEFKESEMIIDQLTRGGDISLFKLKFQLLVQEGKKTEAEALLKDLVLTDRAQPAERLWLAQAQRQVGQLDKSEELVRAVVEKDDKLEMAEAWLLLANLLREQKKSFEAHELLNRVRRMPASEKQLLVSARVAETIGEMDLANQLFPQLVQKYPDSLMSRRELASFYLRQKMDQMALSTINQLSQMIAKNPKDPLADEYRIWANRAKVVTDVATGLNSYDEFVAYDDLLKKAVEERPDEVNDLVLRISLLTQRQEAESLRKAIELLHEFDRRQPLQAGDQLLLARLYSKVGEWDKGRAIIETLALKQGADPKLLVAYAEMLVQNEEYSTAQRYLERYIEQTKDRQPYLILLGTVYGKLGDTKKSLAVINEWLGKRPVLRENLQKLQTAAATLESLGQIDAAEDLYRELAESGVMGRITLAKFIGEHRDMTAGLAILQEVFEKADPKVAPMLVKYGADLLRTRGTEVSDIQKQEAFKRIAVWLKAYRDQNPEPAQLNNLLAELRILQEDYAKAAELYRASIGMMADKNSVQVASLRNNLAYVLALTGDKAGYTEALQAIEQAIRTIGPQSDLLDTRGLLLIQLGDYAKAERDLADAVLIPSASKYFRLAYAQFKLGKTDEATASIRKARQRGLKLRELSPPEQAYYEQLRVALGDEVFASAAP
jgi:Tfp pilus assembly protein PilF